MISEEQYKRLEDYLGNNLSPEEALAFEKEMEESSELNNEFLLQNEINHFISKVPLDEKIPENEQTKKLREFITSSEAIELKKSIKTSFDRAKKRRSFPNYWIAASIVALFSLIGLLYYSNSSTNEPQQIFAEYYNETEIPSYASRGNEDQLKSKISEAFKKKEYALSLELFSEYSKGKIEIDTTLFLIRGASNLGLVNTEVAIQDFKIVAESNLLDRNKGQWFLALTYLKGKQIAKAKEILIAISNDTSHFKKQEASEILKKMFEE